MRRPKHKTQVDTFPFLAVLLCAMGSFILLLMMIDRRAKIVSQNKAHDAYLARKMMAESERSERDAAAKEKAAKLDTEWRAQKDAIHVALKAEEESLSREIAGLFAAMAKTEDEAKSRKSTANSLAQKVSLEDVALRQLQKQLAARRDEFERARELSQGHLKLREQMTRDLALLELALRNVQARQVQQRPVYSLVPYKGKHGSSGKPIYIEVTEQGVAVHPGPTTLTEPAWSSEALRHVIEERTGPLEKIVPRPGLPPLEPKNNPYLLFLVRPGGIARYYDALGFLNGYHVDFGYELIEPDWVFDFSNDKLDQQPWRNAARTEYEPANVTRPAPKGMGPRVIGTATGEPAAIGRPAGAAGNVAGDFNPGQRGPQLSPVPGASGVPVGAANFKGGNFGQAGGAAAYGSTGIGPPPGSAFANGGGSPGASQNGGVGMTPYPGALNPGNGIGGASGIGGGKGGNGTGIRGGTNGGSASPIATGDVPGNSPSIGSLTPPNASGGVPNLMPNGVLGVPTAPGNTGGPAGVKNWAGVPGDGGGTSRIASGNPSNIGSNSSPNPSIGPPAVSLGNPHGSVPGAVQFAPGNVSGSSGGAGTGVSGGVGGVSGSAGGPTGFNAPGATAGQGNTPKDTSFGGNLSPGGSGEPNPFAQSGTQPAPNAGNQGGGGAGGASVGGTGTPGAPATAVPGTIPANVSINFNDKQPEPPAPPRFDSAGPPIDNPLTFRNVDNPAQKSNANPEGTNDGPRSPGIRPRGSGDAADGGEPGPAIGHSPFLNNTDKSRQGPRLPALGRIIGNRDFILTVDCFDTVVTLSPPGRTFDLKSPDAIEQLAKQMKILVDRRQQTVRPGEPPYRPIVQFRVQPDGRRTYYSVYPRLAEFGFAMTRENPD